jgi:hypothetical protein
VDDDPRLNISLTPAQADAVWRLVQAARTMAPKPPPYIPGMAHGSAWEDDAIRRWHGTFRASGVGVEAAAIALAEVVRSGALGALEREGCTHPVVSDLFPDHRLCKRCFKEVP